VPGQQFDRPDLVALDRLADFRRLPDGHPARYALARATRPTSAIVDSAGAEKSNVAGLGEALYTDHLLTVELVGTLLFVALIAAVAITNPGRSRPAREARVDRPARV
jgi:NADH-quinone oxidoreductase subunit J